MTYSSADRNLVRGANVMAVLFSLCLLAAPYSSLVQAKKYVGPKLVQYYVHEKRTPPASLLLVAPVAGPLTNVAFGSVIVIDNTVRLTNETDSKLLGRQLGSVVVGSDNTTFYASFTTFLNTTAYQGSLTVTGIVQSGIMVVTGGTESFSFATGLACPGTLRHCGWCRLQLHPQPEILGFGSRTYVDTDTFTQQYRPYVLCKPCTLVLYHARYKAT